MYISIDRNDKGKLEIDEKVITKQVEFTVKNNVQGIDDINVLMDIHHENTLFILVKMVVSNKQDVVINAPELTKIINEMVYQDLMYRPKKISYAYVHAK